MKGWERHSDFLGKGDWHVHTRYTDGRNTVAEMCRQAQKNGLRLIAFTEHVRKRLSYDFSRLESDVKRARKRYPDMRILLGCEAKVLDTEGNLDVSPDVAGKCEIILGTFHSFPLLNEGDNGLKAFPTPSVFSRLPSISGKERLEKALVNMLKNPDVDIWTHPLTFFQKCPMCEKDVARMIKLCIENKVLVEDNIRPRYRSPRLVDYCRRMGATIVKSSDAHGIEDLMILKEGNE